MVTFGPPVVLDGPLPKPLPGRLLSVPGVLQDPGNDRWMNGVALWGYPEGVPGTWDPCSTGTFAVKSDDSSIPTPDFAAFVAYLPVSCSSFSLASDPDGFAMKAEIALDATISLSYEAALSKGVPMSSNPFLADANVDVLAGGAAVSVSAGFAYLEEAIGATGRMGMIHATPGAASAYFGPWRDYRANPDTGEDEFLAQTPLGTPIAIGGGYIGATPFGESSAAAGQSWIYATGPVQAFTAVEARLNIKEVLDRSNNDVTFRAERDALVEWDTALQAAVLVDWTP